MRRPAMLLVCLLALATGLALVSLGATLTDPAIPTPPPTAIWVSTGETGAHALATRFYAALDAAQMTGDGRSLAEVVTPDFVDHFRGPEPDSHRTVAAVLVAGDRAVVYVHTEATGADAVEVLRLADGRVAERWGMGAVGATAAAGTPKRVYVFVTIPPVLQTIPVEYLPLFPAVKASAGGTPTASRIPPTPPAASSSPSPGVTAPSSPPPWSRP